MAKCHCGKKAVRLFVLSDRVGVYRCYRHYRELIRARHDADELATRLARRQDNKYIVPPNIKDWP